MDKMILLLEEFILKSIALTETMINSDYNDGNKILEMTNNRERLLFIIDQMTQKISWNEVDQDKKDELSRQIEYIKKLDEKLLSKLQEHTIEVKKDIERTHRHKENIRGYNLSDVK